MADMARALVLRDYRRPPAVEEVVLPAPGPGELLVGMRRATVCGTDVHIADGRFPGSSTLPLIMGHEGVGVILAAGSERSSDAAGRPLRLGDLVVWDHPFCGRCPACTLDRQPTVCEATTGNGWGPSPPGRLNGTFSTHLVVDARSNVLRVPDTLSPELVSSATCALRTVMHATERSGPIGFADRVVVLGAGAVGLYSAAVALAAGAYDVVVIGAPASRLDVTRDWGLGAAIDLSSTTPDERIEAVLERTGGRGADLVIEAAGPAAAFNEGLAMVRRGGRYLVLGQADAVHPEVDTTGLKVRQISVQTSLSATIAHYHQALCFLERHGERFHLHRLVSGSPRGLDAVPEALDAVRRGTELKPVIDPGGSPD
jgi:L-iditol 2-dehydrogenase